MHAKAQKRLSNTPKAKIRVGRRLSIGLSVLLLLTVIAGAILHQLLLRRTFISPWVPARSGTLNLTPTFEIYPEEPETETPIPPETEQPRPSVPTPKPHAPRIAIVIDDIGNDIQIANKFMELDASISLAILPHSAFNKEISRQAKAAGIDLLLHLPMEPQEYPDIAPGLGALLVTMSPNILRTTLNESLSSVEGIRGVNNHMGSRFTAFPDHMKIVFSELKKRNLFFLDSRTTPDSCAESAARTVGLPFASRNVFLDHTATPESTRRQLEKLLSSARRNGAAIGIGHPHESTYLELVKALPVFKSEATLVPISQLIHLPAG